MEGHIPFCGRCHRPVRVEAEHGVDICPEFKDRTKRAPVKLPEDFHVERHARHALEQGDHSAAHTFALLAIASAIEELAEAVQDR